MEPFCTCLRPKKTVLRFEDSADFCIGQLDTRPVQKLTTSSATESLFSVERKKVEAGFSKKTEIKSRVDEIRRNEAFDQNSVLTEPEFFADPEKKIFDFGSSCIFFHFDF